MACVLRGGPAHSMVGRPARKESLHACALCLARRAEVAAWRAAQAATIENDAETESVGGGTATAGHDGRHRKYFAVVYVFPAWT